MADRGAEAVANHIEVFYYHRRSHPSLGYQTPAAVRAAYAINKKPQSEHRANQYSLQGEL